MEKKYDKFAVAGFLFSIIPAILEIVLFLIIIYVYDGSMNPIFGIYHVFVICLSFAIALSAILLSIIGAIRIIFNKEKRKGMTFAVFGLFISIILLIFDIARLVF